MLRGYALQLLVFSTWTDVLDLLAHALNCNHIQFCYGNSGAKLKGSLDSFKSESDKQVLLLLLKRAGAGLNIVEAQHAFLMEPSTDPAIEAQVCTLSAHFSADLGKLQALTISLCPHRQWHESTG